MKQGEPLVTYNEAYAVLKLEQACKQAGGRKNWLYKNNVKIGLAHLYDILKGNRHLSNEDVLRALKLKRMVVYVEVDEA